MSCCSGVQVALSRLKAETQTDSSALIFCTVSVPTSNLVAVLRMPMPFRGDLLIADAVSVSTVGRPIGRPFLVPCTLARKASHDALVDQAAFEFAKHAKHLKHDLTRSCRGVETLDVQMEVDADRVDF